MRRLFQGRQHMPLKGLCMHETSYALLGARAEINDALQVLDQGRIDCLSVSLCRPVLNAAATSCGKGPFD